MTCCIWTCPVFCHSERYCRHFNVSVLVGLSMVISFIIYTGNIHVCVSVKWCGSLFPRTLSTTPTSVRTTTTSMDRPCRSVALSAFWLIILIMMMVICICVNVYLSLCLCLSLSIYIIYGHESDLVSNFCDMLIIKPTEEHRQYAQFNIASWTENVPVKKKVIPAHVLKWQEVGGKKGVCYASPCHTIK